MSNKDFEVYKRRFTSTIDEGKEVCSKIDEPLDIRMIEMVLSSLILESKFGEAKRGGKIKTADYTIIAALTKVLEDMVEEKFQ